MRSRETISPGDDLVSRSVEPRPAGRRDAERAARLSSALAAVADAVVVLDSEGRIDELNPAASDMLGAPTDAQEGGLRGTMLQTWAALVDEDDEAIDLSPSIREGYRLPLVDGVHLRRSDGGRLPIEGDVVPLEGGGAALVIRDVGDRQLMTQKLSRAARFDPLTGLLNRDAFDRHVQTALDRMDAGDLGPDHTLDHEPDHVLVLLDLDRFQLVNETCGHAGGDALLQWVASQVRGTVGGGDAVARVGGDELALLIDGGLDTARERADAIHRALREFRFVWQGQSLDVGASLGLVPLDPTLGGLGDHFAAADRACQLAKQRGRGRSEVYRRDAEEIRRLRGWMGWVSRVRTALDEDRFELWWQLIEPLGSPEPSTDGLARPLYEVLVRLRDEDGRVRTAGEFLPAVERFDYATALDRWMIRHVLRRLADSPRLLEQADIVTVNLSGASLDDPDLGLFIEEQLEATGVDGGRLGLEITETAAVQSLRSAQAVIEHTRACGVRWLLDDFGSGMSSYGYLRQLPVDFLKIDGQIVRDARSSRLGHAMVESIHQIARVIGARTVAEHVDGDDLVELMRTIGVEYVQGFHVAEPEPMTYETQQVETQQVEALARVVAS